MTEDSFSNSGWTLETYAMHMDALRKADERFNVERDRRYAEVKIETEKAIKIKETADLAALTLARESQLYKDQQADIMREKNLAASGIYATNTDLANVVDKMEKALKPLVEFVNSQQGAVRGNLQMTGKIYSTITAIAAGIGILVFLATKIK